MKILPLHPSDHGSPEALGAFLGQCQAAAQRAGRAKLVSISLQVGALDPLKVLEAIFESDQVHFYAERPSLATALAGAEIAVSHEASGPERTVELQAFIDETLEHTIAVGDVEAPFGGPHFFTALTFGSEISGDAPFPVARAFVPRWQVSRAGEITTAVANVLIAPEAPLGPLVERVWRAHGRFRSFAHAATSEVVASGPSDVGMREAGDYRQAVERGLAAIADGEVEKIVLARAQELRSPTPWHPLRLLAALRRRFPECYAFSLANGTGQSFIGASPERLVRVSQGLLETEALAGSTRRGTTVAEDDQLGAALQSSEKDRREQGMVLASIRRRLEPLGLALEFSAEPALVRLANVQHLHTPVRAVLSAGVRLLDVVARLHPTPAVGGSPREAAVALIPQIEGFDRGLYAGALGWVNSRGGGEFFVGIRSALVDGKVATLYAGAGIVAGSTAEKEFAETELKFKALRDAFLG